MRFFLSIILLFPIVTCGCSQYTPQIKATEYDSQINDTDRLVQWQELIDANLSKNEFEKVSTTNTFINSIPFGEDIDIWNHEDYWATPNEFIGGRGGDCEDYATAKYFSLKYMGIDIARIHIAYVKIADKGLHHMVLLYFPSSFSSPLVLDNLNDEIVGIDKRDDLEIIYTSNEQNVWILTNNGSLKIIGTSEKIQKWSNLLQRTEMSEEPQPDKIVSQ